MKHMIFASLLPLFACATSHADKLAPASPSPVASGHAPVNGIKMYYEVYGEGTGEPLVLLHGGGSTIDTTFGRVLPALAKKRKVIAIEEQAHGRTSDRNQPLRFETSADDVAALLKHLKVEKADLFGFSNGASVAMQVAIRHPKLVRKLVFASAMTKRDGAPPQLWSFMKQADVSNMPSQLKEAYTKVAPHPENLKVMHDKCAERMLNFKDVNVKDVKGIRASTLILIGDQDVVRPEHAFELARTIPGARLAILPTGHGEYIGEIVMAKSGSRWPELSAGMVEEFLNQP